MSFLSQEARDRLIIALTSRSKGNEVANAIESALVASPAEAVADVAVVDASDLATAIALANANKAKINELLGALRDAGILAE